MELSLLNTFYLLLFLTQKSIRLKPGWFDSSYHTSLYCKSNSRPTTCRRNLLYFNGSVSWKQNSLSWPWPIKCSICSMVNWKVHRSIGMMKFGWPWINRWISSAFNVGQFEHLQFRFVFADFWICGKCHSLVTGWHFDY